MSILGDWANYPEELKKMQHDLQEELGLELPMDVVVRICVLTFMNFDKMVVEGENRRWEEARKYFTGKPP